TGLVKRWSPSRPRGRGRGFRRFTSPASRIPTVPVDFRPFFAYVMGEKEAKVMHALQDRWEMEGTISIPLLGEVAAGKPLEVFSVEDSLDVPESLWRGRKVFALRVRGQSMVDAGIRDGDYLIVEPCDTADDGRTVVAEIDGHVTVKKLFRSAGGQVRLQPANPEMLPLIISGDQV